MCTFVFATSEHTRSCFNPDCFNPLVELQLFVTLGRLPTARSDRIGFKTRMNIGEKSQLGKRGLGSLHNLT